MKTLASAGTALLFTGSAFADGDHAAHREDTVKSPNDGAKVAAFDIVAAHAHHEGSTIVFHMTTNGTAGSEAPDANGEVGGATV